MGNVACWQFYVDLHPPCVYMEAIREREPELIYCHVDITGRLQRSAREEQKGNFRDTNLLSTQVFKIASTKTRKTLG